MWSSMTNTKPLLYAKPYALTRGPLQDAPGANAIWNITNVTHRTKMGHYMTAAYATKASQDPDVQAEFYNYFPQYNLTGDVETDIYNYLMMNDQIPESLKVPEMKDEDYVNFTCLELQHVQQRQLGEERLRLRL